MNRLRYVGYATIAAFLLMFIVACTSESEEVIPLSYVYSEAGEIVPPMAYTPVNNENNEVIYSVPAEETYYPEDEYVLATASPEDEAFEYWLSQMTIEQRIGQIFMLRLPWQTTYVNTRVENLFASVPAGGAILFSDNVTSATQVRTLTADIQALSPHSPMLISIDEEGGRVSRAGRLFAEGITPAAYDIGRRSTSEAYDIGKTIGEELVGLGLNVNFAPVADIWSNPENAVIGNRAFGRTAEVVSPMVAATVEGLQDGGVMATLKHFPGHGDTYEDSHFQSAVHHHGWERWLEMESQPFISGINAGVGGVMIAHVATPAIGGHSPVLDWMQPWIDSGGLPATLSDFWLQEVLRGQLGFEGLIITDALDMRALTDHFTCGQIALGAFLAGADILLIPLNPQEAFDAMLDGYQTGVFDEARLNESLRRIFDAHATRYSTS
ncbi:MAG: glycoside hydrolase family 3 protein [Defluviitaleaceae bacterium]|nr:glycoside hydrolase family 3 protein [Defluviitaleaceae bacterium]